MLIHLLAAASHLINRLNRFVSGHGFTGCGKTGSSGSAGLHLKASVTPLKTRVGFSP
jgi:hypothetical protein